MDTVLDALADRYRRRLLVALLEHDPQDDANPQILPGVEAPDEAAETLETAMIHVHLPKLEDTGFVEWDGATNEVRRGPRFDEIRPLLQLMRDRADELPDDWL